MPASTASSPGGGTRRWCRTTCTRPSTRRRQGIGTGPFKLDGSYVPNDHVNYVKNPHFWKPGLPYLDGINYKIITDEQSRIAALKAGAIDGGIVSSDNAWRSTASRA